MASHGHEFLSLLAALEATAHYGGPLLQPFDANGKKRDDGSTSGGRNAENAPVVELLGSGERRSNWSDCE